jgi:hypothetical protein
MNDLLNNNSSEKTVVTTYIVEETAELIYDNEKLDKWNDLVSQLNLQGQTKIVQKDKSPIPFLHMNSKLVNTFLELCPRTVDVGAYDVTPIPVEILDLIALSMREGYFTKIEISYNDQKPDPICVGVNQKWILHHKNTYNEIEGYEFRTKKDAIACIKENGLDADAYCRSWEDVKYLIGRWGDENKPLKQLQQEAYDSYVVKEKASKELEIKKMQRELEDLNNTALIRFL